MLKNIPYSELPSSTQQAINEYELLLLRNLLRNELKMHNKQIKNFLIDNLAPDGFTWSYELEDFLLDGRRQTKQQHMAYYHLKGYGILKIRSLLGIGQPTIVAFKDNPTYEMFPLHLPVMWQTTPDIEINHQNMIRHFAIHPNICGGFQ